VSPVPLSAVRPAPRPAEPASALTAGGIPSGVPAGRPAGAPAAGSGAGTPARPAVPAVPSVPAVPAARAAPAVPAGPSAADFFSVRVGTDAELHEFALRVLRLADNPKLRRDLIAGWVRFRLAGETPGQAAAAARPAHRVDKGAVTERAVAAAAAAGARLVLGPRAVLTPLAKDKARALGVPIDKER